MNIRLRFLSSVPLIVCIFLFCLSSVQQVSTICIGVLFAAWLFSPTIKDSIKTVFSSQVLLFSVLYYVLCLASVLYSANKPYAYFDLGVKLSFLVLPFILTAFSFEEKDVRRFKLFYVAGCIFSCIGCVVFALIKYSESQDTGSFFYEEYSHFMHPAYFSIYLNLALLFVMEDLFSGPRETSRYNWPKVFLLVFFFANIVLLSARTAWATAIITSLIYLSFLIYQKRIRGKVSLYVVVFLISALALQFLSFKFYNRLAQVQQVIQSSSKPAESAQAPQSENSTTTHIALWKNAFKLIEQNPVLGVGIGDVHDELNKTYEENNYHYAFGRNFNAHNQYLNTAVALGIVGLVVLMLMLVFPAFRAIRNVDWIYALFLCITALNCLTESVLERQAGIIFFVFFMTFFNAQLKNE